MTRGSTGRRAQRVTRTLRAVALCVATGSLAACAPGSSGPAAAPGASGGLPAPAAFRLGALGFERSVAPFEVLDAGGVPYEHPFLGGFVVPRPQLADLDGDGDLDLFVQERTGALMHFENVGTASEPRFVWRSDRYHDLDVGEWARFHDLDGDGRTDVFAETRYSYARYYRNVGTASDARFELVADSLRDADGRPIFADRQNIPALADVDCNGRTDLFLGRVDGTVARYEEVEAGPGVDAGAAPRFVLRAERFEDIEIVAQIGQPGGAPPSARHGANSMAFGDVDGDGDPDLLWGDYFEPGVLFIENRGSCARPNLRSEPVAAPAVETILTSGYNAPFLADLDADGDLDLLVGVLGGAFNPSLTASDNLHYYEMGDDGRFERRTTRFLNGIDVGSESAPALADLDGDGDLDLLVGNKLDPAAPRTGRLYRFENQGDARSPRFVLADTTTLVEAYHYAPALADLDGDGRAEMLLGTWNEGVRLYRNVAPEGAAPRWVAEGEGPYLTLPRGSHATPAVGDLDGDGLPDVVVGEASGELNYFRNVGTATEPRFELVTEALAAIDVGRRSAPALIDVDGDGRVDLVVGAEDAGLQIFLNRGGAGPEPGFEPAGTVDGGIPGLAQPAFADLDGDGRPELVTGTASGGLVFLRGRPAG